MVTATAIDDRDVYAVTWPRKGQVPRRIHGVIGRTCRVTLCELDFIHVAYPYVNAAINCQRCLAKLGDR